MRGDDDRPLVSIITPVHNAERFLAEHLASVAAQTVTEWEHILIDDASTDGSAAMLTAAGVADHRVKPAFLPRNSGAHAARNEALSRARGRYVAFLDADDLWLPTKLEEQVAFMAEHGHHISYHWYRCIDEAGQLLSRKPIWMPPELDYPSYLRLNGTMGNLTVMIDTDATGPIRLPDVGAEDFALYLDLLKRHRAHGLFSDLARHRVVRGSLSSNKAVSTRWVWDVYRKTEGIGPVRSAVYMSRYIARGFAKNVTHKGLLRRQGTQRAR